MKPYSTRLLAAAIPLAAFACGPSVPGDAPPATATALASGSTVRIVAVNSGKALDVQGARIDDGAPIQQWTYAAGGNQQWVLQEGADGSVTVAGRASGKCLGVDDARTEDGAPLRIGACTGSAAQRFSPRRAGGAVMLVVASSGKCVDVAAASADDGATIQQWSCGEGENQRFRIEDVRAVDGTAVPPGVGARVALIAAASGKALDVAGASRDDGALVQQWAYVHGVNQTFTITPGPDGLFALVGSDSGKCLDVVTTPDVNGSRVQQWGCAGATHQLWGFRPLAGGAFAIVSAATGRCLDVSGARVDDGAPLQQWDCWGAPNQAFYVKGDDGPAPPPAADVSSLRAAAVRAGKRIGVALSASHFDDARYGDVAAREFDYLTPENEMKWDATEPSPGQFTFGGADALVDYAGHAGMAVKGHTLVWHNQLPEWVARLTDPNEVRAAMTRHIETLVDRYRGKVLAWDVVNEAIDDNDGNAVRNDVFHAALGDGYIAEAFRIAHAKDPDALLFYNDYGIEGLDGKANAAYALVKRLVAEGVPISGVGLQTHVGAAYGPSAADIRANMQRIAALGLLVNVSELDAGVCQVPGDRPAKLAAQATRMHDIVAACVAEPRCHGVTLWGLTDRYSWLNDVAACSAAEGGKPWGLAFDEDYGRKPAWQGIADALVGR